MTKQAHDAREASQARCQSINAEGKRCRTPRTGSQLALCTYHARQQQRQKIETHAEDPSAIALDLLGHVDNFYTAVSINHVIGRILTLLASDRISPRKAAVLAYTCQLLLQSLDDVKSELSGVSPELHNALHEIYEASRRIKGEVCPPSPTPLQVPPVQPTDSAHSQSDHARPDHARPDHNQPDRARPDHAGPDHTPNIPPAYPPNSAAAPTLAGVASAAI
ncbi:MAG: hypothetical protein GZ088_12080 [Acidipila sp.]|nr:hypothetical protein [Acidipila sp.]